MSKEEKEYFWMKQRSYYALVAPARGLFGLVTSVIGTISYDPIDKKYEWNQRFYARNFSEELLGVVHDKLEELNNG